AIEGYNSTHDLCRSLINAAVRLVERRTGRAVANYDFLLVGRPDVCSQELADNAIRLHLDDAAVERKLAAALGYPELASEVERALAQFGKQAFATECLRPVDAEAGLNGLQQEPPFYETYGEKQVAAGYYQHVIRYRENVLPLARGLWNFAGNVGRS